MPTDHEATARRILTEECNDLCGCGGFGPDDEDACDACRFYHAAWPNVAQALAETEAAGYERGLREAEELRAQVIDLVVLSGASVREAASVVRQLLAMVDHNDFDGGMSRTPVYRRGRDWLKAAEDVPEPTHESAAEALRDGWRL